MRGLLVLCCLAGVAGAADVPRDQARALYARGQKAYDQGRYREAAAAFQQAYAIQPATALLFNQAQAWRHDFELTSERTSARQAVDLYRRYLASPQVDDQDRREAADRLAALSALLVDQAPGKPPAEKPRTALWIGVGVGAGALVALAVGLGVGLGLRSDAPAPTLVARW